MQMYVTAGALEPCRDLLGWWLPRCGAWIVVTLALLGNVTVLIVSVASRNRHVTR